MDDIPAFIGWLIAIAVFIMMGTTSAATIMSLKNSEKLKHIEHAVDQQPEGAPPLVDNVKELVDDLHKKDSPHD